MAPRPRRAPSRSRSPSPRGPARLSASPRGCPAAEGHGPPGRGRGPALLCRVLAALQARPGQGKGEPRPRQPAAAPPEPRARASGRALEPSLAPPPGAFTAPPPAGSGGSVTPGLQWRGAS